MKGNSAIDHCGVVATSGAAHFLWEAANGRIAKHWVSFDFLGGSGLKASTRAGRMSSEFLTFLALKTPPAGFARSMFVLAHELGHQSFTEFRPTDRLPGIWAFVVVGSLDDQVLIDRVRELPQSLRVIRFDEDDAAAESIARAVRGEIPPTTIIRAYWDGLNLRVINAALEELSISRDALVSVKNLGDRHLAKVAIDLGDLHFPTSDVHLDWESLQELVDPEAALRAKQVSVDFNRRYGAAIRSIRVRHNLRQEDIKGLSERHVSRIESGEQRATKKALAKIAQAHGMSIDTYLSAVADEIGEAS